MTLLVALQRDVSSARARVMRASAEDGIRTWLYVGEDSAWSVRAERGELAALTRVPLGARVEHFSWELRSAYIDWVGELSLANDSLEWWGSELAAKNPFMLLYNRLCALAAARESIAEGLHSALVVCSSPALMAEVVGAASERGLAAKPITASQLSPALVVRGRARARGLAELWARRAPTRLLHEFPARLSDVVRRGVEASPAYRRRLLWRLGARKGEGFRGEGTSLLFTWVDGRSLGPHGAYRDPHFGKLPQLLRDAGQRVAFVPHFLPGAQVEPLARRLLDTGEALFFPELFVSDVQLADCRSRAERFAPAIEPRARLLGVPVARLAIEQVESLRPMHSVVLGYEAVVRGLLEAGVRPERVFLPYEGHSWEQVVSWAYRRYAPDARLIGYDNVNFSRLALSMYPARCEYGLRPLPDRIVTNGNTFRRVLEAEGFPQESIRVGCALRHQYIGSEGRRASSVRQDGAPIRVLVATSIDSGQSVELIEAALRAFGGADGFRVIVKLHPAVDDRTVHGLLDPFAQAANVEFETASIQELLPRVDVLLYMYTVVCYEALAHGVPCVFVKSETGLDLDQLEPFPELRRAVRSVTELRTAVTELTTMTATERTAWERKAREAVETSLAPVTPSCAEAFLA